MTTTTRKPRTVCWIVIVAPGDEPQGVEAESVADIPALLGVPSVALCAPTTRAALLRAGWTDDTIRAAHTTNNTPTEATS